MIQIPSYVIKREIGSGGMATVYLAVQASLEREVAVKVMNPSLATDPNFSRRFFQEARTLASLSHPNIVAVYDVGVTDNRLHYFSMQYMPNGDLTSKLKEGISEAELHRVLDGVCRALRFAHSRGFVHRDVSPANIMFDLTDTPILTDFGIARAVVQGTRLTSAGISVGTSHYMSPEQARGSEIDGRSDIYSLGAVIFEVLAGKPPFDGDDGFAIAYSHVFEPVPVLPSHVAHWQPLVNKALAKKAEDRFADVDQLKVELDLLRRTAGQEAESTPRVEKVAKSSSTSANVPITSIEPIIEPDAVSSNRTDSRLRDTDKKSSVDAIPNLRKPSWPLFAGVVIVVAVVSLTAILMWSDPVSEASPTSATSSESHPSLQQKPLDLTSGSNSFATQSSEANHLTEDEQMIAVGFMDTALEAALLHTVFDPYLRAMVLAKDDLSNQRLTVPPGRNALERYRRALAIRSDSAEAKLGIVAVAAAYAELAARHLSEGNAEEFLIQIRRAEEIAASLPEGSAVLKSAEQKRFALRDKEILKGKKLATAWRKQEAIAAFQSALQFDPNSDDARRGIAFAQKIGAAGFVFRDTINSGKLGPEMIVVQMPRNELIAVARTELTVAEFKDFWTIKGRAQFGDQRPSCRDRESFFRSSKNRNFEAPGFAQGLNHPVVCVTWDFANAYVQWLTIVTGQPYRLPSAAEWRAMVKSEQSTQCRGNVADASFNERYRSRSALTCKDGYAETAPVAKYSGSNSGLFDLYGNVREWVSDCAANCASRLAMGSAWLSAEEELRLDNQDDFAADVGYNTVGFRVVRDLAANR